MPAGPKTSHPLGKDIHWVNRMGQGHDELQRSRRDVPPHAGWSPRRPPLARLLNDARGVRRIGPPAGCAGKAKEQWT